MFGMVRLGTNDLERAKGFYDDLFAAIGIARHPSNDSLAVWGTPGQPIFVIGPPFDGEAATSGNGTMISLLVDERAKIDRAHATALALGGKDEGAPGLRGDPAHDFYAAYLRDLDGNKLCFYARGAA